MNTRHLIGVARSIALLCVCVSSLIPFWCENVRAEYIGQQIFIPSVNPFYTEKDLVFDTRLQGTWLVKDEQSDPMALKFERSGDMAYKLTIPESGHNNHYAAHLFKIKQQIFLDVIPTDRDYASKDGLLTSESMFPGHVVMLVSQIEPKLKLVLCNLEWMGGFLTQDPAALEYRKAEAGGDFSVLLTADTGRLQHFVMKHFSNLFKEDSHTSMVLIRKTDDITPIQPERPLPTH